MFRKVLFFVLPVLTSAFYAITLPSSEEECLRFMTDNGAEKAAISGDFEVLDVDEFDKLEVKISEIKSDGTNIMWTNTDRESTGTFRLEYSGTYSICFLNKQERDDKEIDIGFNIRSRPIRQVNLDDGEEGSSNSEITGTLLDRMREIEENLHILVDHQVGIRDREATHRDIIEATFGRVVKWTISQVVVVLSVACGQIWYLKKFFESKRYL